MILPPVNDTACLGPITALARERATGPTADRSLVALARELGSTAALVRWIRELPQRDDTGDPADGPKVDVCVPRQRLRAFPGDPNCLERAVLYVTVAELIDPVPVRRLQTITTSVGGLHTFPVEDGAVVVLDPHAAAPPTHGHRNGATPTRNRARRRIAGIRVGRYHLRFTPEVDRALRVAARAAAAVAPHLAPVAARLALASFGVPPTLLEPIETALRYDGRTLGIPLTPTAASATGAAASAPLR